MAAFQERCGSWRALVRMNGRYMSATFSTLESAKEWAEDTENRVRSGAIRPKGRKRPTCDRLSSRLRHTYDEILRASEPHRTLCGVYFLIKDDVVVYVGQSIDVDSRLATHKRKHVDFDSFT